MPVLCVAGTSDLRVPAADEARFERSAQLPRRTSRAPATRAQPTTGWTCGPSSLRVKDVVMPNQESGLLPRVCVKFSSA